MKFAPKVFASLMTLLAVGLVHAAETKPVARVIVIQEIETDDPFGYVKLVAASNDIVKEKLGLETYSHVYFSNYDGVKTMSIRSVTAAESVAALAKNSAALENEPALKDTMTQLRAIRKLGARVLYQGLRFDGTYPHCVVYTTTANVSYEAGYLKALDGLRAIFDAHGLADAKINAYRVLAGRSDHTHRVTIAVASGDRLAALLDFVASDPAMAAWLKDAAKLRTVVANGTSNEITK